MTPPFSSLDCVLVGEILFLYLPLAGVPASLLFTRGSSVGLWVRIFIALGGGLAGLVVAFCGLLFLSGGGDGWSAVRWSVAAIPASALLALALAEGDRECRRRLARVSPGVFVVADVLMMFSSMAQDVSFWRDLAHYWPRFAAWVAVWMGLNSAAFHLWRSGPRFH